MYKRLLDIDNEYNDSVLLFGARQTKKNDLADFAFS